MSTSHASIEDHSITTSYIGPSKDVLVGGVRPRAPYTTIACVNCIRRKVKCSGSVPCSRCVEGGLVETCSEPGRKTRGKPPAIELTSLEERAGCAECQREDLRCERDQVPCSNCVERGRARTCSGFKQSVTADKWSSFIHPDEDGEDIVSQQRNNMAVHAAAVPPQSFVPAGSDTLPTIVTVPSFYRISEFPLHLTSQGALFILCVLRYLSLASLLFLPLYYTSQAGHFLDCAEICDREYVAWISASEQTISTTDDPIRSPSMPPCVQKLHTSWTDFLDSRKFEWNVLLTISVLFIGTSPTIFQAPDISNNPIVRGFAFLAICRAISGIFLAPLFSIHFREKHAMSVHYAFLWAKESQTSRPGVPWCLWTMISLPAAATLWAMLLFVCALLSYIWKSTSDSTDMSSGLTAGLVLISLRTMIMGIFTLDLIGLFWSVVTFYRYKRITLKREVGL